ncbi:DUF2726 domain-containing protein [Azonexus sp.]|uniref:DUF2726 domain-containing protein n=1 Tax=Azonexus sp. TaxID=1872668 RepID=UPI0039E4B124
MENFALLAVLAALIVGGLFLMLRRSPKDASAERFVERRKHPRSVDTAFSRAPQVASDALDPQTRFVEPAQRKPYRLLNDSEQELYQRLCEAMPNMRVFAQVGVAQLALARGRQEAQRLNRMAGRGVDFVVCDHDFSIIAAIELVWPSALPENDNAEDVKRVALQSLGIPLIVFHPNKLPDVDSISRAIADAILRRKRLEAERG